MNGRRNDEKKVATESAIRKSTAGDQDLSPAEKAALKQVGPKIEQSTTATFEDLLKRNQELQKSLGQAYKTLAEAEMKSGESKTAESIVGASISGPLQKAVDNQTKPYYQAMAALKNAATLAAQQGQDLKAVAEKSEQTTPTMRRK